MGGNLQKGNEMSWSEDLPENIRTWDEVTNSETPEAFWQQMESMRSHIGQSIRVPSTDAGDEAWKEFNQKLVEKVPTLIPKPNPDDPENMSLLYKSLGHPEASDKYVMPTVKEGMDMTQAEEFRAVAHKHGLTQKQFEGVVNDVTNTNIATSQDNETQHAASMQTLRTDWGLTYDTKINEVKQLVKATNGPTALLESIEIGKASADVLIWLSEVATRIGGEATNLTDDKGKLKAGSLTPAEARGRLNTILGDRQHPYWLGQHPGHKDALREVLNLQSMANPNASTQFNDLRLSGRAARDSSH